MSTLAQRQAFFDEFAANLRKQGEPAISEGACLYFDEASGNRCGIGHMIVPAYSPLLEDKTWAGICERANPEFPYGPATPACLAAVEHINTTYGLDSADADDRIFIAQLQNCHDDAFITRENGYSTSPWIESFETALEAFAERNALTYTPPQPTQLAAPATTEE